MGPKVRQFRVYEPNDDKGQEVEAERLMIDNAGMAVFFRGGQAIVWIAPGAWTWIVDEGDAEDPPAQ